MKITKDNPNEVLFENHDARLLITDAVIHTNVNLYYYHDIKITVQKALDIWHKAQAANGEENGFYSVLFLDFSKEFASLSSGLQHVFTQQHSQRGYS